MADSYDVIVVGAGPAGACAALEAARLGCGRVVLLERARLPRGKLCAGGVSPRACDVLRELGLYGRAAAEGYPVRGIRCFDSTGREIRPAGLPHGLVVPRRKLDSILVDASVRAGVELHEGTAAEGLVVRDGRAVGVRCGDGELRGRWVVGADGWRGRFSRDRRPRTQVLACMARFRGVPFEPHVLEAVFPAELAPCYGWLFPESADEVNIGIAVPPQLLGRMSVQEAYERFLDRHYGARLAGARRLGPARAHPLSTTIRIEHRAAPGVLLVGEAARLVSQGAGEGIYYALGSGLLAARAIRAAQRRDQGPLPTAGLFLRSLRRAFQARLWYGALFPRFGRRLVRRVAAWRHSRAARRLAGMLLAHV